MRGFLAALFDLVVTQLLEEFRIVGFGFSLSEFLRTGRFSIRVFVREEEGGEDMGQQQSKEELLYQQVEYGNVDGINALKRDGAGLEWIDREGKTPLILACLNPERFPVAKALITLGANVNAYRPGSHAGTPLHHAAKRGIEPTVKLLLSSGANPFVMNDDCQTPLDVARAKGFSSVVRAIESHICLFSGSIRELLGPSFLEALAPQWLSRKIWAVVLPCGTRDYKNFVKLELAIYPSPKDAQPRVVIQLWKAKIEEPKFQQSDPVMVIIDKATTTKTKYKLASANEGDKQQLQSFYAACTGIPQVVNHPPPSTHGAPVIPSSVSEDVELAMAINASIQSAMEERPPLPPEASSHSGWADTASTSTHNGWGPVPGTVPPSKASSSGWLDKPAGEANNGWVSSEGGSSSSNPTQNTSSAVASITHRIPQSVPVPVPVPAPVPSAPPITEDAYDGPIHYPSIDISRINISTPTVDNKPPASVVKEDEASSSSCVICLDAPVEGACIPCGHMAGCMSCLKEIEAKKWGCPVCRTKITQVIRLYAV